MKIYRCEGFLFEDDDKCFLGEAFLATGPFVVEFRRFELIDSTETFEVVDVRRCAVVVIVAAFEGVYQNCRISETISFQILIE